MVHLGIKQQRIRFFLIYFKSFAGYRTGELWEWCAGRTGAGIMQLARIWPDLEDFWCRNQLDHCILPFFSDPSILFLTHHSVGN